MRSWHPLITSWTRWKKSPSSTRTDGVQVIRCVPRTVMRRTMHGLDLNRSGHEGRWIGFPFVFVDADAVTE